jgi:uncharacterized protein (DUF2141 family)
MSAITRNIVAITGFTSASGTDCAGPTRGWAASPKRLFALAALGLLTASAPLPSASLRVEVEGLRDHKGALMFCLTRRVETFLDCDKDPHSVHAIIAASGGAVEFEHLAPGDYALLLLHDANRNGKLDKRFGIPREGFGFSNNPAMRFGPPTASQVTFVVPAGASTQVVRMKYIF